MKNGGWKTGCAITKTKGIRGRVLEQIMEKIDGKSTEEVNQILETDSGICFTLDECVDLVRKHPTLVDIATRIAERSPGFQVYEDHKSRAFREVVIFLMELACCAMFHGTHGYAMEKAFQTENLAIMVNVVLRS